MGCGTIKKSSVIQPRGKKSVILFPGQFIKNLKQSIYSLYTIKSDLGSGSYGRVVSAIHNQSRESRAIKIINKLSIQSDEVRSKIMNEVEILKGLDHPNIVKLYEFHEDEFNLYLVTELCSGGELLDSIIKNGNFDESQTALYLKQILSAVVYLHSLNIVHRDLKLENLLIEHSRSSNIKIIDFGASCSFVPGKFLDYRIGTINYIAPEVIKKKYTERCDVWSCGVILYVLLSGKLPFSNKVKAETVKLIQIGEYDIEGGIWGMISPEAKDLIVNMIEVNPVRRFTAAQAFAHPWLQNCSQPSIKPNLLQMVSQNLKTFNETSKLQRAVIRFIASQLLTPSEKGELVNIFQSLDSQAVGKFSESELRYHWRGIFNEDLSEEEAHQIMIRIDTDKSGFIEYSEFLVAAMDKKKLLSPEHLEAVFQAFDSDKNGKISAVELKHVLDYQQNLDISVYANLIKEVDQNGDGCVDYREFKIMMTSLLK